MPSQRPSDARSSAQRTPCAAQGAEKGSDVAAMRAGAATTTAAAAAAAAVDSATAIAAASAGTTLIYCYCCWDWTWPSLGQYGGSWVDELLSLAFKPLQQGGAGRTHALQRTWYG